MNAPGTMPAPEPTYIERVAARAGARIPPETVARVCRALRDEPLDGALRRVSLIEWETTLREIVHEYAAAVAERAAAAVRHMGAGG